MSETTKQKGVNFPKWIIWERSIEYVVPHSLEECLTRLNTLTKPRQLYAPKIHMSSEIDGVNHRLLMEFVEGKAGPVYALIFLINLDLSVTRVLIRLGFSAWMIVLSLIFPIMLLIGSFLILGAESAMSALINRPREWIVIFIFCACSLAFIYFIGYVSVRFKALAHIRSALSITSSSK